METNIIINFLLGVVGMSVPTVLILSLLLAKEYNEKIYKNKKKYR